MLGDNARSKLKKGETYIYDQVVDIYRHLIECPIRTIAFVDGSCRSGGKVI